MRQDILDLIKDRPSWILHSDEEYSQLIQGMKYAYRTGNKRAEAEFEVLLEARRSQLLDRT